MSKINITTDSGALAVKTPYSQDFVYELKRYIPAGERRWDGPTKRWMVAFHHGKTVQDICQRVYGETPALPNLANAGPITKQTILDCRYIGITKNRGDGDRSAFGWSNGGWSVVFPEDVLRAWFDAPATPNEQLTLYSVLGCKRGATLDEIKVSWRRMAFQWHPDRCKEPDAQDQFIAIQHAYEVLINPDKRERYDAGLALEESLHNPSRETGHYLAAGQDGYRAPLRCGLIMVQGTESMGLLTVSKIFAWQDITDQYGRVLVVSWPRGADHFQEVWA